MAFQGIFKRHNKFVVVKPIRLTAKDTLEVGTVIDMKQGNVKWFQLRLWFRRRRIGTEGSDWVNQILDGARRPEGAAINTKYDIENLAKTLSAVADQKAEDNPPLIGLETQEGAEQLENVKPADAITEPSNAQETVVTEPETTQETVVTEPELSKEDKARAAKDRKNARERQRRADKAATKAKEAKS